MPNEIPDKQYRIRWVNTPHGSYDSGVYWTTADAAAKFADDLMKPGQSHADTERVDIIEVTLIPGAVVQTVQNPRHVSKEAELAFYEAFERTNAPSVEDHDDMEEIPGRS